VTCGTIALVGALGLVAAIAWPAGRAPLTRALGASACVFLALRLAYPWQVWLARLPLDPGPRYWLVTGPGGGLLGLLPAAVLITLLGRWLFDLSPTAQWAGRLSPSPAVVGWGGAAGIGMAVATLGLALAAGAGTLAWAPHWAGHGVNLFSNLYEEILARGLLLQVVARHWGRRAAILWTGAVFGLMHGLGGQALVIGLVSWSLAWAVLRAGSLWGGWVAHQVADVLVDSLLHP
jgi:membrane protease YdiL (CAAX protease family)